MIILIIYLIGIVMLRHSYRLMAKHKLWLNKDCHVDAFWFIPFFNIVFALITYCHILDKMGKDIPNQKKKKLRWKIFNWDL